MSCFEDMYKSLCIKHCRKTTQIFFLRTRKQDLIFKGISFRFFVAQAGAAKQKFDWGSMSAIGVSYLGGLRACFPGKF